MSIIYRKVARDLFRNKTRTLLVVLSTAVGILALGMVISLSSLMSGQMTAAWKSASPPHLIMFLGGVADEDTIDAMARTPGIRDVQPRIETSVRWKKPGEKEWRNATLLAVPDFRRQQQNVAALKSGQWPQAGSSDLVIENLSSTAFDVPVGSEVMIKTENAERTLRVVGTACDMTVFPPGFGGDAYFFVSRQGLQDLTGQGGYNEMMIRLPQFDKDEAQKVGERVKERLEKLGYTPGTPLVMDPNRHFAQEQLDAIMLIMGVLGILSLALSAFLVTNTVNAVLAQQISQIGVMKAVGATPLRVMRVYLAMVLAYGLLAVILAVPLAALAANMLANVLLPMFNVDTVPFRLIPEAIVAQAAVGLLIPVLAALFPVLSGARITVRQAIASYGLDTDFGRGLLDRLVARIHGVSRPIAISLRNTFRRKGRVALTLLTLGLAGMMFIVVMSTHSTMIYTVDQIFSAYGFDVMLNFSQRQRFDRAETIARTVPGVVGGEIWIVENGRLDMGGNRRKDVTVWGLPTDSTVFTPQITGGRWFRPGDENVLVVNAQIAQDEGLKVGDRVNINLGPAGDSTWEIIGLLVDINNQGLTVFAPRDTFSRVAGQPGQGSLFWIKSSAHDQAFQEGLEKRLRAAFEANSIKIGFAMTSAQNKEQNFTQFNIITLLLLSMAMLAGAVGSLGLMSTMSINVLERSKEIGVMRAIGASSPSVVGIFVVEGLVIGLLSMLVAAPFSYPGARLLSDAMGRMLFQTELKFQYSIPGLVIWLGIVMALSILASLWPALRAARVSVRETLAYE